MRKKRIIFFSIIFLALFLAAGYFFCKFFSVEKKEVIDSGIQNKTEETKEDISFENNQQTVEADLEKKESIAEAEVEIEEDEPEIIPEKVIRDVDFVSQAPFAIWDELHEEACEEASLIMVKYFLDGETLTTQIMEDEIQAVVKYQIKKYGDYKDSDTKQMLQMAREYFEISEVELVENIEKQDIKKYLIDNIIIIPAAGRELGNPNFTPPGPLYHSLVLIGYENDEIITNDPGTRKGKNYRYDIDTLFNSIHDFTGQKEDILEGGKNILVFKINQSPK